MKKLAVLATIAVLAAATKAGATAGGAYPDALMVTSVTCEGLHGYRLAGITQTGLVYEWICDDGDWIPGDLAAVVMADGGTAETVLDDYVIECRYAGWTDPAEWVK